MLLRIIAGTLAVAAIAAGTVGIGTPTPEQDAAWSFLHHLRSDGVEVHRVTCGRHPVFRDKPVDGDVASPSEEASHLLEVRGEGGNTTCRVHLPGRTVTVPLYVFEDGSYRFVNPDDRP
jgi:hypothetical protein